MTDLESFTPSRWVSHFRNHTPRTRLVPLSRSFLRFLVADGIYAEMTGPFPQLTRQLERALLELNGSVQPKLGTVCPMDATWIMPKRNTECTTVEEIMMLLKASDRIADYVQNLLDTDTMSEPHASSSVSDEGDASRDEDDDRVLTTLALRQWSHLTPSMEFRCFVRSRRLCGISQRHIESSYPHLSADSFQTDLIGSLENFVHHVLLKRRDTETPLDASFTADVYVDRDQEVWLLDLAPFGPPTDPLLFTWSDLSLSDQDLEFRHIPSPTSGFLPPIRPCQASSYGVPFELQGQAGLDAVIEAARKLAPPPSP
mmetsp:Transcript_6743/g.13749  ORF Transcript_6743/g.13749 Transcript_6743/m.13749 type:complete len:314 (-) Transcript_6743:77-1018(-)|eukprot:CAMPEP_0184686116 /NCGR_PEP_ID=MMETSP0312-20130426/21346_1 /TAXON_ID=31354 /ORGANISM="Compsopogon coeruleus, Strain SAG 36.94" /LENGTH=313 /DNA_ID=CAMNT_0027140881 /DNA_START=117 /DNA_END=1058 /DNA_ORIENTATION=-